MTRLHLIRSLRLAILTLFALCALPFAASAQTATATLSGTVIDPNGAVVPGAIITLTEVSTQLQRTATTDDQGHFSIPLLKPSTYLLQVEHQGFLTAEVRDITLNVGDERSLRIQMKVGDVKETVNITAETPLINESPAVSTVVDQNYVKNMPLNGRSIQNLILLTPGVVSNSPQLNAGVGRAVTGEFSVNGQRTESNYYTVDGVSANLAVSLSTNIPGWTGSMPASTALGTTQGLVSLDALEEFRIQSSTYSAEYGRNPGGQFSFVTRSGTNQWHGTAFDYIRNNVFDASDWFNNYFGKAKPPERQNDFGGTFSGPVLLPHFGEGGHQPGYSGRDRTFFFLSNEELRLAQPQAAAVVFVPSLSLRVATPAPLQQVLNAFPLPNGTDLGNGLAQFIATWSNPSRLNSTSVRLDHTVDQRLRLFFRFSDTSSKSDAKAAVPSVLTSTAFTTRTYTFGATSSFSSRMSNEFRLNYSSNVGTRSSTLVNFGGAIPVDLVHLQGFSGNGNPAPQVTVGLSFSGQNLSISQSRSSAKGKQQQWNVLDTLAISLGRHEFKFGIDFRRLNPSVFSPSPLVQYTFRSATSVRTNSVDQVLALTSAPAFPIYTNFAAFAQDQWRLTPRLSLSVGLRWEINPAPGAAKGNLPYTVQGNSLSTLSLAPQGTPLWATTWFNFAPRLGAAYVLRKSPGHETVVHAGAGVFFDTGQQLASLGYVGPGFSGGPVLFGSLFGSPASFPVSPAQANLPIVNPPVAPYGSVIAFPAHLQLPYTLQWNVRIEQALGKAQALTVSYVGANGRRLLETNQFSVRAFNPLFSNTVAFITNGLTSEYEALQAQYQRRLARGLQTLASYTWGHAIDYGSRNSSLPYIRGNSDYDIRHSFSGALSYDLPNAFHGRFARTVLHHWGLDDRFTARTGFPVTLDGVVVVDPSNGQNFNAGLNLVPGQPLYVFGTQCSALYNNGLGCPGGKAINPMAFSLPSGCTASSCPAANAGNAPRNLVRGFGAWQMDFAVRRDFPIHERLKLQLRAEAFNVFNHPNFGTINARFCGTPGPGCTFGQATNTLANALGGLSSLYQMGGARSMQFALKLVF